MEPAPRIDYICIRCEGSAVTRDAWAEWSRERQDWVVSEVFDFAFCHQCHRQTQVATRALDPGMPSSPPPAATG